MELILVLKYVAVFVFSILSIVFLILAYKLTTANENEYRINRSRSGCWYAPLIGGLSSFHDGRRDHRVCAGLAVDIRKNEWVEQGALSEEALDSVIRH